MAELHPEQIVTDMAEMEEHLRQVNAKIAALTQEAHDFRQRAASAEGLAAELAEVGFREQKLNAAIAELTQDRDNFRRRAEVAEELADTMVAHRDRLLMRAAELEETIRFAITRLTDLPVGGDQVLSWVRYTAEQLRDALAERPAADGAPG